MNGRVVECPYCGNRITFENEGSRTQFSLNVNVFGMNFSTSRTSTLSRSRYHISCGFCGREYFLYDIDFRNMLLFARFEQNVIAKLYEENIDISKLPELVVGVAERTKGKFSELRRRLRRKFSRVIGDRFLEVVFEVKINNELKRGVLIGRVFESKETGELDYIAFEHVTWLGV